VLNSIGGVDVRKRKNRRKQIVVLLRKYSDYFMKIPLTFISFFSLILSFTFTLPLIAKEHPRLVLKSTTTKRVYYTKINIDGTFNFVNVQPGTYTFSLVGTKDYFAKAAEMNLPLLFQNMVWTNAGFKTAAYVKNMELPDLSITTAMLANPTISNEKKREYSLTLNPSLTTVELENLSGKIINFPKGEY
jgi:hypothetical protein